MKRSPLKRKTPLKNKSDKPKNSKGLFDHLKKESKDEEWRRVKREILDPKFEANGLKDTCEIIWSKCVGNALPMHYAHSRKRGDIAKEEPERTEQLCEVVRACPYCHDDIEYLPERNGLSGKEQMYILVTSIIRRREGRLP